MPSRLEKSFSRSVNAYKRQLGAWELLFLLGSARKVINPTIRELELMFAHFAFAGVHLEPWIGQTHLTATVGAFRKAAIGASNHADDARYNNYWRSHPTDNGNEKQKRA